MSCMSLVLLYGRADRKVNDGITFEQSVLTESTNQKPSIYDCDSVVTKLARDSWTLEQLEW